MDLKLLQYEFRLYQEVSIRIKLVSVVDLDGFRLYQEVSIKIKLVSVVDLGNVYLEEGLEVRIGFLFGVGWVFFYDG